MVLGDRGAILVAALATDSQWLKVRRKSKNKGDPISIESGTLPV